MVKFILVVIFLFPGETPYMAAGIESTHENMIDCMLQREYVVEQLGRPIRNYQAICVQEKSN